MPMQLERECSYARSLGSLSNFLSIEDEAKSNLHFKYGSVTYEAFSKQFCIHSSREQKKENLTAREKIKRVFQALYHAVYHAAQALFTDLFQTIKSGDSSALKAHLFCSIRDLQECFGYVVSLLFPQYGLYHVQAGCFQRQCYILFLDQKTRDGKESVADREQRIMTLAEDAFKANDLDDAFALIMKINNDTGTKDTFLIKIAKSHYTKGHLDSAFKVIMKASDCDARKAVVEEIAERHFYNGDHIKASQVLQVSHGDNKNINVSLSIRAAERHLAAGNMEEAFKVICNITSTKSRNFLLGELAKCHHTKGGNYRTVLKVILEISDYDIRDNVVVDLTEQYFAKDHLKSAFELIKWLVKDKITKQTFILKLAERHLSKDELDNALEVSSERYMLGAYVIKIDNSQVWEAFFLKLAEQYFAKGNLDMAFSAIKRIEQDGATRDAFLARVFHEFYEQNNLSKASEVCSYISQQNFAITYQFSIDLMIAYHKQGNDGGAVSFARNNIMTAIFLEINRQLPVNVSKEQKVITDRVISLLDSALTAYGYNQKIQKALTSNDKATITADITTLALDVTEKFNDISSKTESNEPSILLDPTRIAASLAL
ncbi:MAG: hypothetical protein WC222_03060 [Parachlamydiales bacterium]